MDVQASKATNRFEGMSTLRAKEREILPKSDQAKALDKYLLKYGDAKPEGRKGKPKKRKRPPPPTAAHSLRIVDMDASGFVDKPKELERKKQAAMAKFNLGAYEDEDEEEGEEDAPVVANLGEAEHLARLVAKEKSGAATQSWQAVEAPARPSSRGYTDASPPRRRRHDSPEHSPPRRQRHDSPDDSPPQRQRHDSPDESPPRRQRHNSPDESPPRKPMRKASAEVVKPGKQRQDTADSSPPRRQRHDSPDASPPRRGAAQQQRDSSPLRRGRADSSDESPPRRQAASSPRRPKNGGSLSTAENGGQRGEHPAAKRSKKEGMSDGTQAGMVSGKQLVEEMAQKRAAERKRFAKLEEASGSRDAQTVYRDTQTGAKMSKEEFEAAAKKASDKKKDVYEAPEWGGGMRQIREREQRAQDLIAERSKPFARTADDVDQELNLKDRARFGDPMAHLVKQREAAPPPPVIPDRLAKQMKKSGFIVPQEVPAHSWLKRNLGPPPNRYGIKPGRHWDGVDRSTGFERDFFKMAATRVAQEREARAWAQADM